MKIFKEIALLRTFLGEIRSAGNTVGLVPTMGALHRGHMALIQASKKANSITVATIYVNPTQFNNASDLDKYPRTLDNDLAMLDKHNCDVVFCPTNAEMYEKESIVRFDFDPLDNVMEGKFRPGHFSGVALVVSKLFNIVEPDIAYFGQKDWQQMAVIMRLVDELKFNLIISSVPIVSESDGLAMSSRNRRLTPELRTQAVCIYQALNLAKRDLEKGMPLESVKKSVKETVERQPDMKLEYFELADRLNLTSVNTVKNGSQAIMCIAAFAGEVRLIDNMFLD
ncbi:MAG: pantoate--beta-alanine ligase [Chryseolinea sp.]